MIAANVDVAFIVQSCHFAFNVERLERYLFMARDGRVEPVVLLTRTDLLTRMPRSNWSAGSEPGGSTLRSSASVT